MKDLLSNTKRMVFREPYLPPPVSPLYLVWIVVVVGGGLAIAALSLSQYGSADTLRPPASLAMGLFLLVVGVAESLPVDRIRLAGILRTVSLVLIVVFFWLFTTSVQELVRHTFSRVYSS
jgi:hypothetical protein